MALVVGKVLSPQQSGPKAPSMMHVHRPLLSSHTPRPQQPFGHGFIVRRHWQSICASDQIR
jgi:hypothetical protein